jgi:alginate O-acetyltransferase complex protein AlgI
LRTYLYIPLGGNRLGKARTYLNLFLTMLLGGIWHGAGWTFVIWGTLHGAYLIIHRAWSERGFALPGPLALALTFLATLVAWVFFRAASVGDALAVLGAMAHPTGAGGGFRHWVAGKTGVLTLLTLGVIVLWAPNAMQLVDRIRPGRAWGLAFAALALACFWNLSHASEFLYFQF